MVKESGKNIVGCNRLWIKTGSCHVGSESVSGKEEWAMNNADWTDHRGSKDQQGLA